MSSVVPSDKTRGNRHTQKYVKFPLDINKHFVTVRVTEQQSREVVGSSSEMSKTQTDTTAR